MNTNKIFHHIVGMVAVSSSLFMASCDYLDVIPTEQADTKDMVIDNQSALKMLYSCYSYMQQPQNNAINYEAIEGENDETVCPQEWGSMGQKAQWNAITPSSINGSSSYPWVYLYNGIGYCNQFLELLKDNNPDLTPQAKAQYEAEATFLKAYYHFRALELAPSLLSIRGRVATSLRTSFLAVLISTIASATLTAFSTKRPHHCLRATTILTRMVVPRLWRAKRSRPVCCSMQPRRCGMAASPTVPGRTPTIRHRDMVMSSSVMSMMPTNG